MDVNIRTEELTTIFLDSEDDEDPLRLSPPPSPPRSTSIALMDQVRQRFADLRKPNTKPALSITPVEKIIADAPRKRIKPSKIEAVTPKSSKIIEIIDLDDYDSPPSIASHNFPAVESTSSRSSRGRGDNGSTGSRIRNGCNFPNDIVQALAQDQVQTQYSSSSKKSRSGSKDNLPARASKTSESRLCEENGSSDSILRGLIATSRVIAVASTSKERGQVVPESSSGTKKSKPRKEKNFPTVASTSIESGLNNCADPSGVKKTRLERPENFPTVASTSIEKRPAGGLKVSASLTGPKKNRPGREEINATMSKLLENNASNCNIFEKFLEICVACDNSPDLKEIHDKKTTRYFRDLQPDYRDSIVFRSLLEESISIMAKNPASVFTCLVNVHGEMKRKRVVANGIIKHSPKNSSSRKCPSASDANEPSTLSTPTEDGEPLSKVEESEEDSKEARKRKKTERHLKKLEKALRQCNLRIKQLEEAEVDWDDEDDSSYLRMQRYRRRCIAIHRKIVELRGERDEALKRRARVACVSPYPYVREAVERYVFVNSTFPDFNDVLKIYKDAKITGLRPTELHNEAAKTFKEIGDQIQKERQVYDWNLACAFLDKTSDPAEENEELKLQLKRNKQLGDSKLDEVMASFTRKQYEQRLEPTEVTDEQAANTDDEDDDEEDADDDDDSCDDMRNHLVELGRDATDSDCEDSLSTNSSRSRPQSQENSPENKSKKVKDKHVKKLQGKQRVPSPPRRKRFNQEELDRGNIWSFTEESRMKAAMKVLPVKVDPPTPLNVVESNAPLALLPPQIQVTYAADKIVSPLRKYQLETLANYLEIKYQIDPAAINAKYVSSSSAAEGWSRKRPGSPSAVADSTEPKALRRCEKTGSDPEVTSTSVDGDLVHNYRANESGHIDADLPHSLSIKDRLLPSNKLSAKSCRGSGDSYVKSHLGSDNSSAKTLLSIGDSSRKSPLLSGDFEAKSRLASEDSAARVPTASSSLSAEYRLVSGISSERTKPVIGDSFATSQVLGSDSAAKSLLASNDSTAQNKDNGYKKSFSEVHSSYVLATRCHENDVDLAPNGEEKCFSKHFSSENDDSKCPDNISNKWSTDLTENVTEADIVCEREFCGDDDMKKVSSVCGDSVASLEDMPMKDRTLSDANQEEVVLENEELMEEQEVVGKEVIEEDGDISWNEDTADLEDWDSMIIPTIVVKEVLVVPTDIEGDLHGTEIVTTTEIDLNSSDEYIQSEPEVIECQQKGRNVVPTKKEVTLDTRSTSSEFERNLPEKDVECLSDKLMFEQVENPLVRPDLEMGMISSASSSSLSSVSDRKESKNRHVAQPANPDCKPKEQENVPPKKILAETTASKGITYVVQSTPKLRIPANPTKNAKIETVSDSVSIHLPGKSGAGCLKSEGLTSVTKHNQAVQAPPLVSFTPKVLSCKPTARKTIAGSSLSHVLKNWTATGLSEPDFTLNPEIEESRKQKQRAVALSLNRAAPASSSPVIPVQAKATARKTVQSKRLGESLMLTEDWKLEEIKEDHVQSDSESPDKSSEIKSTDPDIIVIDLESD